MTDDEVRRILSKNSTYYDVLGVDTDATDSDIESAYREIVKTYHPDVSGLPEKRSAKIIKRAKQARKVLTDPRARQSYDSLGHKKYVKQKVKDKDSASSGKTTHEPEGMSRSDEVKAQATSRELNRQRARERRKKESEQENQLREEKKAEVKHEEESCEGVPIRERIKYTTKKPFRVVESKLSNDVISSAVRKAWTKRLLHVSGVLSVLFIISGFLTSILGITALPSLQSALNTPEIGVLLGVAVTIVAFGYDQYKTEQGGERGGINVAATPHAWYRTVVLNSIGVGLYLIAIQNGVNPLTELMAFISAPESVGNAWVPNSANATLINGTLAVIMCVSLFAGGILGLPTLSRLVWYDRYVTGYRVLPAIWEMILFIPVFSYLWMGISSKSELRIPMAIGEFAVRISGQYASGIGITSTTISEGALLFIVFALPVLVGIPYGIRRGIEYAIQNVIN